MGNVGNRIKQLRKELGITQEEFSRRIGVKRNTIANYELGRNDPVDSVLSLICREYGVREEWLRTGEGDMYKKLSRNEEIARMVHTILTEEEDSFKARLIEVLINLEPEDLEVIAKIARELADPEEARIKKELADYERELRQEKKAADGYEASGTTAV